MASHSERFVQICRTCGKPETTVLARAEAERRGYCLCLFEAAEKMREANTKLEEEIEVINLIKATGIPYHSRCNRQGCKTCKR